MLNQFSRTQLLLGEEAMNKLKTPTLQFLESAEPEGNVCEALARSGVGNI